ncbi:MAG: hypothetical protein DWQ04_20190 [Chloroflexi bacterium]|nr:MAG: hypothetical protein DWQ04_20190 [Chloroflexota bacterium]
MVYIFAVRRLKYALLLIVPAIIFLFFYHPFVIPHLSSSETFSDFSAMTFNVRFGNQDYDAVVNIILTYQPDLVALQEVQPEMMDALQNRLEEVYPYSQMGLVNQYGTTAVFSRYSFSESYILDLEVDRPAVVVKIEINGNDVAFISAHLQAYGLWWVDWKDIPSVANERTKAQNRQAQILIEEVEKQDGIVILGCDCNSKEASSSYRMLANVMQNTARQIGWQLKRSNIVNAKQDVNLQHIDYIFFHGEVKPVNIAAIRNNGGSDHLPVLAEFHFNQD